MLLIQLAIWLVCMVSTGLLVVVGVLIAHRLLHPKKLNNVELPPLEDVPPRDEIGDSRSVEDVKGTPKTVVSQAQHAIITEMDLTKLQHLLDEKLDHLGAWKEETRLEEMSFSYILKSRKPKDGGATQYLSTTTYKDCSSTEQLRDFTLDYDFRKEWDDKFVDYEVVDRDKEKGLEIFCMTKKFPYLGTRVYMLAHKVWEGENQTFFCFTKACHDPKNPNLKGNYVQNYLSGWRICKVRESNACELKRWHQEDFGTLAKFFARNSNVISEAKEQAKLIERSFRRYVASGQKLQKEIAISQYSTKPHED